MRKVRIAIESKRRSKIADAAKGEIRRIEVSSACMASRLKQDKNGVKFLEVESPKNRALTVNRHNEDRRQLMRFFSD